MLTPTGSAADLTVEAARLAGMPWCGTMSFDTAGRTRITQLIRYHDLPIAPEPKPIRRLMHKLGVEPVRQLAQVPGIERIGGAQRHADSVKAHGVVPRKLRQHLEALAVALEVVFAVYLKPAHSGQGVADLVVVRGA